MDYLLDSQNHRHTTRSVLPELLRGNPTQVKLLIDSVPFKQRYTSGVISFAPEESARLSGVVKTALIDSFQEMVAPGVPGDCLSWIWVQHSEHGRFELHWVVPNVELGSGNRFAPYYDRADRPRFIAWQKYQNLLHELADPQDPGRRRAVAASRWTPQEGRDNAAELSRFLEQKCMSGELRTRADLLRFLTEEVGVKVPRQGKDYITVQYGEGKHERFRLRGAICHEDYRFESTFAADANRANKPSPEDRGSSLLELRTRLEDLTARRSSYLRKRLRKPKHSLQRSEDALEGGDPFGDKPVALDGAAASDSHCIDLRGHDGTLPDLVQHPAPGTGTHVSVGTGWEEISDRRRPGMEALPGGSHREGIGIENRHHHFAAVQATGVENDESKGRTGSAVVGLLEAIQRRIRGSAETNHRAAFDLFERLHRAIRGIIDPATKYCHAA